MPPFYLGDTVDKFEKRDLTQCENLIKAIKKAKFELDGMEVLAMSEVMKWINLLFGKIQADLAEQEAREKETKAISTVKEVVSPITKPPKPQIKTKAKKEAI